MVCPWSQFKSAVHSTPFHTQKVTSTWRGGHQPYRLRTGSRGDKRAQKNEVTAPSCHLTWTKFPCPQLTVLALSQKNEEVVSWLFLADLMVC